MTIIWLAAWLLNSTPPLWVQHHAAITITSSGAGLTNWGIVGAVLMLLDFFSAGGGASYRLRHRDCGD
jgi:hypothetical protein